jgi:hypothetical protein
LQNKSDEPEKSSTQPGPELTATLRKVPPVDLLDWIPSVSRTDRLVLEQILNASRKGQGEECKASHGTLSSRAKIGRRTLGRAINGYPRKGKLPHVGLIDRHIVIREQEANRTRRHPPQYKINVDELISLVDPRLVPVWMRQLDLPGMSPEGPEASAQPTADPEI